MASSRVAAPTCATIRSDMLRPPLQRGSGFLSPRVDSPGFTPRNVPQLRDRRWQKGSLPLQCLYCREVRLTIMVRRELAWQHTQRPYSLYLRDKSQIQKMCERLDTAGCLLDAVRLPAIVSTGMPCAHGSDGLLPGPPQRSAVITLLRSNEARWEGPLIDVRC